jgi:hypothetical protein
LLIHYKLADSPSASLINSTESLHFASSDRYSRFFSISPMYFEVSSETFYARLANAFMRPLENARSRRDPGTSSIM